MLGIFALLKTFKGRKGLGVVRRGAVEQMEPRVMLAGNGLSATYFDNINLTGKTVSRVDGTVNFNWGAGSPAAGIGADTFSARWTGQVAAQKSETYTFSTLSDDGVRVWVGGKLVVNDWSVHAPREASGTIALQAGERYDVKVEYYDQSAGAVMKLMWASASTPKQFIPQAQLYSTAQPTPTPTPTPVPSPPPPTPVPAPIVGNGNGLLAAYYDNADLTGKTVQRTDKTVSFDWGVGPPAAGIGADTFSARWVGQVMAQRTEEYTFFTQSDDGVRLWVNGQKLVDNWSQHASTENAGKIKLEAGKKYDVKLEYFDQTNGAVMQLKWATATTAKGAIPQSQLFSAVPVQPPDGDGPTPVPTPTPTPTPTQTRGLLGTYYDNTDFTGSSVARYDSSVQFDWGTSSPHEVIGRDGWAARWQGQVVIPKSETYTFAITSGGGGARLWVDGKVVIDDWANHAKRERSGSVGLSAGRHDVKLEYYLVSGSAVMQFRWSSPSIAKGFVPEGSLFAAAPPALSLPVPPVSPFTGYKTFSNTQVNFRPGSATNKDLTLDGYRISKIPIDTKGMNVAVTDLQPGQKAWAYRNLTIKNTEISDVYRTPGFHNDFIRIAGAAGRQDVAMNITLENIKIHDGQAIPILITDGDYDTIIIRNVSITNCSINQLQINTQNVGSVKRVIVENCPGLGVALVGRVGTIGECIVRNSPGARVSDSLNQQGEHSGVKFTIIP